MRKIIMVGVVVVMLGAANGLKADERFEACKMLLEAGKFAEVNVCLDTIKQNALAQGRKSYKEAGHAAFMIGILQYMQLEEERAAHSYWHAASYFTMAGEHDLAKNARNRMEALGFKEEDIKP